MFSDMVGWRKTSSRRKMDQSPGAGPRTGVPVGPGDWVFWIHGYPIPRGAALKKQFHQIDWDKSLEAEWHALLRLAADEDLGVAGDLTTRALVPDDAVGRTAVVARQSGIIAGAAGG